jgi:hypothetical protein
MSPTGSVTAASAPEAREPRPPTCKSLFWATELGCVVIIIADLLV